MGGLAKIRKEHVVILVVVIGLCSSVVESRKHVSIKNRLGAGNNITLHCQSKDNDLGQHNRKWERVWVGLLRQCFWNNTVFL